MMTVKISRLTKVYGQGKNAVVALNEFDLEIAPNEVCIVRGPNGSGKSTLISILSGELEQTAGSISLSAKSGEAPVIAIIGQFHNLIDELTVAEHFALLGTNQNLDLVPSELLDQRCAELSRGQAQMVAIALALTTDVDVLLADEPTGALGADESEAIYDFIKRAAHQHQSSVLLVTHDIHADRIADRIVRLRDGRLSESWTFGNSEQQVISSTGWVRLPEAVVDGMNELVDIRDDEAGATIRGRQRPPLSDVHVSSKRPAGIEPVVTVSALETRYGKHVVGRDINVTALADELLCVVGKSGAGKTTLLKTLSGLHNDFAGEIQKPDVLPYFSSEHLFGSGLSLKEFGIQPNLVTALSLDELVARRLDTLSGGQQQRALVAIALSSDHPVLLLDEPTSALDDVHAPAVIRAILESPKTIVAATHDERLIAVANQTIAL